MHRHPPRVAYHRRAGIGRWFRGIGGGAKCLAEYDSTESEGQTRERWFVHGPVFPDPPLIHFHRVKGPLVSVDLAVPLAADRSPVTDLVSYGVTPPGTGTIW